VDVGRVCR